MTRTCALAAKILATNVKRLSFPYKLTLIVTYNCNLRCRMCNIWQRPVSNEFTLDEYERFFSRSHDFNWVNMSGGEIFLRRDLLDIVKIITSRCRDLYLLDFPTAGLMTGKVIETVGAILRLNIKKVLVTVSMDGPPRLHDEIRGVPGAWEKATDTFLELRKMSSKKFGVYFGVTISGFNQDALFDTVAALTQKIPGLTYRDIHVNIAHLSSHYYGNDARIAAEHRKVIDVINAFRRAKGRPWLHPVLALEDYYLKKAPQYIRTGKRPLCCQALESSVFIDPHGDVFPCSIYDRKLASLRDVDYDLAAIWNSENARRLRAEIVQGACPHCWTPCEAYQSIFAHLFPYRAMTGT
ncbi:MAG: radical SAM protein [Candidatus Omnitrophica bacterium]|nr:radical SAM protein [Candidatus Omnitrophota bacterium]